MIVLAVIAAIAVMLPLISFATSVTDESSDTATMPEPVSQITDGATNVVAPTTDATKDTSTETAKKEDSDSSKESSADVNQKEETTNNSLEGTTQSDNLQLDNTVKSSETLKSSYGINGIDLTTFPSSAPTGITCNASTKTITFDSFTYSEDTSSWTGEGQAITFPEECTVDFEGTNNFSITGSPANPITKFYFFHISDNATTEGSKVHFTGNGSVNLNFGTVKNINKMYAINCGSILQIDSVNINIEGNVEYNDAEMVGVNGTSVIFDSGNLTIDLTSVLNSSTGFFLEGPITVNGGEVNVSVQGKEDEEYGHLAIIGYNTDVNVNGGKMTLYGQDVGAQVNSFNVKNDGIVDIACSGTAVVDGVGSAIFSFSPIVGNLKGYGGEDDNVVLKSIDIGGGTYWYYLYSAKYSREYEVNPSNDTLQIAYKARIQGDGVPSPSPTPDPTPTPAAEQTASTSSAKTADDQNVFAQLAGLLMQVF